MTFVQIPKGTFWMGGGGGKPGSKQVEIAADFYLGVYPITQGEWQGLMGDNPSWFCRDGLASDTVQDVSNADLKRFPVEMVSWEDAKAFIDKLNARERGTGWLYRLPTEAEWEYACRGGASSPEACAYHFYLDQPTNSLSSLDANFDGSHPDGKAAKGPCLKRTTKVGSYKANSLGLYDMHGNVWEWCEDLYESGASARVLRGGSWNYNGRSCRSASRGTQVPDYPDRNSGLRLAAVPAVGAKSGVQQGGGT
jgi:formylglycine-generating enzyme required for sulfatase activity